MDEEDEHSPREVNIILNIWKLLMQKLSETGIDKSQEAKDDFINQQKSANCLTQTRRRLLILTLVSATLKLMV